MLARNVLPSGSALRVRCWQRQHGDHFAHVDQVEGNRWQVSIWRESRCLWVEDQRFARVAAAQAHADMTLRRRISHRCAVELCGTWVPVGFA